MDNHRISEITKVLPQNVRSTILRQQISYDRLEEVHLRTGMPLILRYDNTEILMEQCIVTPEDMREALELISNHSLYAYEDDIRQGFITIPGGHRVGLAGKIVMQDGKIKTIKHISFLIYVWHIR